MGQPTINAIRLTVILYMSYDYCILYFVYPPLFVTIYWIIYLDVLLDASEKQS